MDFRMITALHPYLPKTSDRRQGVDRSIGRTPALARQAQADRGGRAYLGLDDADTAGAIGMGAGKSGTWECVWRMYRDL